MVSCELPISRYTRTLHRLACLYRRIVWCIHSGLSLQQPVEEWPICDCLISFHSKGFPLDKAIQYEKLRKPYVINNLHMQYDIQVS